VGETALTSTESLTWSTNKFEKTPLRTLSKKESPYPKYDVLGEFLAKVPSEEWTRKR
jgi:hypothetical protein